VADDRIVFLHNAAEAHDHYFFTERDSLSRSPAIAIAAREALAAARIAIDDVAYFDLYSCFPSAVQIARDALGIAPDDPRPLTVTGGLGFAGGPVNNYPTHAIARMVETLRADHDAYGLTTALGWYVTKHAVALWSARPPATPFATRRPQAAVDALARREPAGAVDGDATVEATAVAVERDGTPTVGIVSALLDDGQRALANTRDADTMHEMMRVPWEGRRVVLEAGDDANTLR
jgi:acetyl-CoA C-acetyltransferase